MNLIISSRMYERIKEFDAETIRLRDERIAKLVEDTVPIYTIKNPDPKTGKEDCRLTKAMKEQRRFSMKNRLIEANGDEEKIKAIIERYAKTER